MDMAGGPVRTRTRRDTRTTGSTTGTALRVLLALVAALATLAVLPAPPAAAADRAFAVRFSTNDTGDIDMFGNTVMTCPASAAGCTAARSAPVGSSSVDSYNNNAYLMEYVDVDGVASTFNSSSSTVALPAGAGVLFAGLYWGGRTTAGSGGSAAPDTAARNRVLLRAPGAPAYTTVTAATVDDSSTIAGLYQGFADVTATVRAAGTGTYTVANVQTATGGDRLGGWTLVVAYRDTAQPARNLTVFDGLRSISGSGSGSIPVSGFQTPPAGDVRTTVGFVTYEGDLGIVGDAASLNGKALSDPQHPATNFFDSRSSRDGVLRSGANPSYANNLGFEHSMLTVDKTYIGNGATSATIGLSSSGDVYAPGVVTFATELYAPRVEQTKTVTDLDGGLVEQGDTLRYTVSGTNSGQDGAVGFVLRDPVPADTTYVPGSIRVTQPGGTATTRTDAAGDDTADFDAAGNRVVARVGTGASATAGGTLAVGASYAVTFDVTVNGPTPVVPSGTVVTNTATASFASASLGTPLTAVSTVQRTVSGPDLAVTKSHTGPLVKGAQATYTLGVANQGPARSRGPVTLGDTLPAGLTFVSASGAGWSCSHTDGTVTCTRSDSLAAGAAYPDVTLVVAVTDDAPATVANTVTVSGGGDGLLGDNSAVDSAPTEAVTDLRLAKTASPATVAVGGTTAFALTVTNDGPSRSTGSSVVDTLPPGLVFVSADAGCASGPTASTVACTVGPLARGASTTLTVVARATSGTAGQTLTNTAVVHAHEVDPAAGNDSASADVSVRPVDLAVTSRIDGAPATLVAGRTYTWQLDVANLGGSPAADGQVRFTVPTGVALEATGLDPRCRLDGPQSVVCDLGTVAAGATVPRIEVRGTVAATGAPASVDTLAAVTTSEPDVAPGNNTSATSSPTTAGVDLATTLTSDRGSASPGDTVVLTATVTNAGPGTPSSPTLTVVVPAGTTFVSAAPGCTYDASTRTVTCSLPADGLEPGEQLSRTVTVTVDAGRTDPLQATATAASASADSDPSNDGAALVVPVVTTAGLSLAKTVDRDQAAPGQTVTYSLLVRNSGPADARDVVVSDALPAGTTYAADDAGCTVTGQLVRCDLGTVAAGTQRTVLLRATVEAVPGDGVGEHQLDVTKVETHLSVPAASTTTATAQCPTGYLATDGSVRLDAVDQGTGSFASATVLESRAGADGTSWVGTVASTATGQLQGKVVVVCLSRATVSGQDPQHAVVVSDPVTTTRSWTAGSHTAEVSCGAGRVAVAPGWVFTSGSGTVRAGERVGDGWRLAVDVPEAAGLVLSVRCLAASLEVAGGHTHDLALAQLADTVDVPAGQVVRPQLTCADDAKGIVAGWSTGAGVVSLGNDPQPRTRVFGFVGGATGSTASTGLLCLGGRTTGPLGIRDVVNTATATTSTPDATTADDTSSATFRATAATGVVVAPRATVTRTGAAVRLPLRTERAGRLTVTVRAGETAAGVRRGEVVARDRVRAGEGRTTVLVAATRGAVRALRTGRLERVVVVVRGRDGRTVQDVRLR